MRSKPVVIAMLAFGLVQAAPAQQVPPGTRVRLTTPDSFVGWRIGQVAAMTGDSVRVVFAGNDSAAIPLASIGLMDRSAGVQTPLWAKLSGVLTVPIGASAGLGVGIVASVLDLPLERTESEEGSAFGAALLGGVAGGVFADASEAVARCVRVAGPAVQPDPALRAAYGEIRERFRALKPGQLLVSANGPGASVRTTVLTVLALTWLNPHVYLDTVLLLGTMATPYPTWGRATFAAGGSLASALWFLALGFGSRWLAPLFASPGAWRVLDAGTAATMMALAAAMVLS